MARKKIIAKQEKPAKQQRQQIVVQNVEKKCKKSGKQQQSIDIFTPQFYKKLDNFQTFYRQVLEMKSQTNKTELSGQLDQVNSRVRTELQTTSQKILRNELIVLQQWIDGQQVILRGQIETVNKCFEQSRKSLQLTKVFTADQITSQIRPIQQKIDEKQATLDNYAILLTRSKNIYGDTTTKKSNQVNINNNDDNDIDMDLE